MNGIRHGWQLMSVLIRNLLLVLLFAAPWFFGGVWASVQWGMLLLVAILLATDLASRFSADERPGLLPIGWLPPLAGMALGLAQLIPFSADSVQKWAPTAAEWRQDLTSEISAPAELAAAPSHSDPSIAVTQVAGEVADDEQTSAQDSSAGTIATNAPVDRTPGTRSLYRVATREYLALLTLATSVFVLASLHLVDRRSTLMFMASMGACGAALSFFGLIQRLSWNGKFYWVFEPAAGGFQSFGPFVNRNNAGGFLNLCLAAGIGC